MSWPQGASVNSSVPRDQYQGQPNKTVLPTLQDVLNVLKVFGQNSYMYSFDIARAYSQLRIDPLDWPLQGIIWDKKFYVGTGVQFGSRWGSFSCQSTQSAVCDILETEGIIAKVYIDDYIMCDKTMIAAQQGFTMAKELLTELGIDRAIPKDQPPTRTIHWIGYLIDSITMTVSISPQKIKEIIISLKEWEGRRKATRHQIQQILGKILYISRCCKPACLFVGRMLQTLRIAPPQGQVTIGPAFKADIAWFQVFLPTYNVIHLIDPPKRHIELQVSILHDNKMLLCYDKQAYSIAIVNDPRITTSHTKELWTILVDTRIWGNNWQDANVTVQTNFPQVVNIINTGASRHTVEMTLSRNIWLATAQCKFSIRSTMTESVAIPPVILHVNDHLVKNVYIDPRL